MGTATGATIASNGTEVVVAWDEPVTMSNTAGLALVGSNTLSLPYVSGSGTDTTTHSVIDNLGPDFAFSGVTYTLAHLASQTDIKELDSGDDVGNFVDVPVVNNSLVLPDTEPPRISRVSIDSTGRAIVVHFNEKMVLGSGNLEDGWAVVGFPEGTPPETISVQSADWLDSPSTRRILRLELNGYVERGASTDSITVVYSNIEGNLEDESGNILGSFIRSSPINNSRFRRGQFAENSPKKVYIWVEPNNYEESKMSALRGTYRDTNIYRVGTLVENQWWPTNTADSDASPFATGEEAAIPSTFKDDFLVPESQWEAGSSDAINLGILRAILRGDIPDPGTFKLLPKRMDIFDTLWQDPEPGGEWFSYGDLQQTQGDKDQVFAAMLAIHNAVVEEVGTLHGGTPRAPLGWYSVFPDLSGRNSRGSGNTVSFGGALPGMAHGIRNLDPSAVDNTALFGERDFYYSNETWGTIKARAEASAQRVWEQFAQYLPVHILVAYPSPLMLPADSQYNVGTSGEGITGGIQLWKDVVQSRLDFLPDGVTASVLLRSVFNQHVVFETRGGFSDSFEAPFEEDYWREMVQFCADNPKVDSVGYFSSSVAESDTGNGITREDQINMIAEIIDAKNKELRSASAPISTRREMNDAPTITVRETDAIAENADTGVMETIDPMTVRNTTIPSVRGPVLVDFGNVPSNQTIRYTTNNKNPTGTSKLYTGPFEVTNNLTGSDNTVIKARFFGRNNSTLRSKIMRLEFRIV